MHCARTGCSAPRHRVTDPACTASYTNKKPREPLVLEFAFCAKHVADILRGVEKET